MKYPAVVDPNQVGKYDEAAYSGGGYFFDEVLEYRVWCYPEIEANANASNNAEAYYRAFATFEQAQLFANETIDSTAPVALIRQLEWIDQPARGVFIHNKGERIAEWQTEWLSRGIRKFEDIAAFLLKHVKSK